MTARSLSVNAENPWTQAKDTHILRSLCFHRRISNQTCSSSPLHAPGRTMGPSWPATWVLGSQVLWGRALINTSIIWITTLRRGWVHLDMDMVLLNSCTGSLPRLWACITPMGPHRLGAHITISSPGALARVRHHRWVAFSSTLVRVRCRAPGRRRLWAGICSMVRVRASIDVRHRLRLLGCKGMSPAMGALSMAGRGRMGRRRGLGSIGHRSRRVRTRM